MKLNNNTDQNSDLQALRVSVAVDDARQSDPRRVDRALTISFNEARYLDTRPTQHMTATWGS